MRVLYSIMFILFSMTLLSGEAMAFNCSGPYGNIPVTVEIDKSQSEIIIVDMNKSAFYCNGLISPSFQDAIRIMPGTAILSPTLINAGFTGFFIDSLNQKFDFSQSSNKCIWPNATCPIGSGSFSGPLPLKIGIRGNGNNNGVNMPAGTELARVKFQQRGNYGGNIGWGSNQYLFVFTLKNAVVIPTYTCNVDNGDDIVVKLPAVDKQAIRSNAGRYDGVSKTFDLNLTCEPKTSIDVRFDGDIMTGHPDVLKNTSDVTKSVGIQVLKDNIPVVFGNKTHVIDSAQAHETLSYRAHYYYNGGALNPGAVRAIATVTFDYQ